MTTDLPIFFVNSRASRIVRERAHLQGTSLVPILKPPNRKGGNTHSYSVVSRDPKLGYAIRDQRWRYDKWPDGEELYQLTKDPHERNNLANNPEFEAQLKQIRKLLAAKQIEANAKR